MRMISGEFKAPVTLLCLLLYLAFIIATNNATIAPGEGRAKSKSTTSVKTLKIYEGLRDQSLQELKLIKPEPSAKDILIYHGTYYRELSQRHFNGTILGYLTPWNAMGYRIAEQFVHKFDIISPVWFQVVKDDKEDLYVITGHDVINQSWLNELRKHRPTIKIFPRFIMEKFSNHAYSQLLTVPAERVKMVKAIWQTCQSYGFEGIVFEFWLQLVGRVHKRYTLELVLDISRELHKIGDGLEMILVVPPYRKEMPHAFTSSDFDKLHEHVYGFSLMTYDYSSVQRPGANAPLYWIREAIEHLVPGGSVSEQDDAMRSKRSKILMGMNLYGNVYTPDGGHAITSGEYLDLLRLYMKRLHNDEHDKENFFEIRNANGHQYVFYPTLYSIHERLKLANEMGVGISLWELGQGLDYFYDLF